MHAAYIVCSSAHDTFIIISHFWNIQSYHEDIIMEGQLVVEPIVCMLILHHKAWPRVYHTNFVGFCEEF